MFLLFCSILIMVCFKLYVIKKRIIKYKIKFLYCSRNHLNSLRKLIFIQIIVFWREILQSNTIKHLSNYIDESAHLGWYPFGMVSIRNRVHSGLCLFGIVFIRDGVHTGLCMFGMVSIRDCVHSDRVHSGNCPDSLKILCFVIFKSALFCHSQLKKFSKMRGNWPTEFFSETKAGNSQNVSFSYNRGEISMESISKSFDTDSRKL